MLPKLEHPDLAVEVWAFIQLNRYHSTYLLHTRWPGAKEIDYEMFTLWEEPVGKRVRLYH